MYITFYYILVEYAHDSTIKYVMWPYRPVNELISADNITRSWIEAENSVFFRVRGKKHDES